RLAAPELGRADRRVHGRAQAHRRGRSSAGVTKVESAQVVESAAREARRDLYFQRTPFQFTVLTFATFGVYPLYWMIRARRFAERRLERHVTSYWFYLTLLIPIYGFIVHFESYSTV